MSNDLSPDTMAMTDAQQQRRLVIRIVGMTAGFALFLVFLAMACVTTTMDAQNHIHTHWWMLIVAFFWACVFMYHIGLS